MHINTENISYLLLHVIGIGLLALLRIIGGKRHFSKQSIFIINIFTLYIVLRIIYEAVSPLKIETLNTSLYLIEYLTLAFAVIKTIMFVLMELFLNSKKGVEVPKIIQDTLFAGFYFILLMIILKEILNINLTSILTTSAVLTMVLGLSLQDNLSNLFSGLAIQLEKPFSIGEWIQYTETIGKVKELSWRSVKLLTLENDLLIVPNNQMIKEKIVNFSRPTHLHISKYEIGVSYAHPPNYVKNTILSILEDEKTIAHEPKPFVRLVKYGDFSITYEVRYYITNFNRFIYIEDAIATKIWYAFKRDNIVIPFPIRDVNLRTVTEEGDVKHKQAEIAIRAELLGTIDILTPLTKGELNMLAENGKTLHFCTSEEVIKEGDAGDSLFVILSGQVDVAIRVSGAELKSVATLKEKDFFGERSLMTGERRNATVTAITDCTFFVINKDTFREVIMSHTEVLQQISGILSRRELALNAKREEATKTVTHTQIEENSKRILKKIMKFLGF